MRPHAPALRLAMPAFMAPSITYSKPRWTARIPEMRGTIEVEASTPAEARFAAARQLGCSVAVVVVSPAYDPALLRFGWRA